jgi:chromosome segregation ATPase
LDEVESESKTEPEAKHNELETSPKNGEVILPTISLTSQETQSKNITTSEGSHESPTGESTGEPKAPKTEEVPSLSPSDSQPDIKFLRRQLDEHFSRLKELEKDKEKLEKENADLNTKYNDHEAMTIGLRADLNRAEATVESLRAQLRDTEQTNEELFEAKKTIYDLREKVVSLQNENTDLKRKLEDARMAEQGFLSEIEKLKGFKSGSRGNSQKSKPATKFSL